jgi:type I restriction enzyme S subunit
MSEWRECRLEEVAIINPSESLRKGQIAKKISMDILQPFTKRPPLFLLDEFNGGMKFRNGDTIVARITPCLENGKTAFIDILDDNEIGFGSTEYIVIREREGISDKHFLYYFTVSPIFRDVAILSMTGSSGRQRVQTDVVKQHSFEIPELPEQKAIAAVLSSLDDKIDLLHRQNKTLEAMAETLFKQWFVVEAREDWENVPFGKWIENTFGGEWGKEELEAEFVVPVYCIRGTDIADLQTGLATKTPMRFIKKKKFESIEPKNGDIIIEISGGTENQSTGRALYINQQIKNLFDLPLVFSNFCRLIRPLKSEYSFFLYSYIQYLYNQDEFFNLENGSSGIKNLNYKGLLFELPYPMPPEDKIFEFNHQVSIYFLKINKNKKQIQTLETLRDNLLPKLMSGEVRVNFAPEKTALI